MGYILPICALICIILSIISYSKKHRIGYSENPDPPPSPPKTTCAIEILRKRYKDKGNG